MFMRVLSLTTTLLWTADLAFAEPVYKCVDGNGTITFTQQACPGSGLTGGKVDIHAAPPGSVVINPERD